jgi:hypothetical protein
MDEQPRDDETPDQVDDLELDGDDAEQVSGGAGTFTLTFQGQTTPSKDENASQWVRVSHPH